MFFFFSSRRRHTRWPRDWSSDVCSSDLSIHFNITNFDISTDADAADGDGYVQYQIDEGDFINHFSTDAITLEDLERSEERRVGKECRCRWWRYHLREKECSTSL